MTGEEQKAKPEVDAGIDQTVANMNDSTDQHLEELVRSLRTETERSADFEAEPECDAFLQRIRKLGPPTVTEKEIGHYELIEQIGRGGMGEVWKARHKNLDRVVAIKLLHPRVLDSHRASKRFAQEMKAIGALEHNNIVRAMDAGDQDGVPYLVMEYVEGRVLSDVLSRSDTPDKCMSVAAACDAIRQVATGLQYAHENGIVHRDIKPSNIIITESGDVKLLDMGLARFATNDSPLPELTAEGQVMGTLDYMPPEQVRNSRTADVPADIYALGATFYKLITGRAPFAGETTNTAEAKILAIATEQPVSISDLRDGVPIEVSRLVDEMLRKEPRDRPASANDVIDRIDAVGPPAASQEPQESVSLTHTLTPPTHADSPNRKGKLFAVGVLGLVLLLAGILITLSDPVYGDLVIEGPDGVTIKATKVDDPSNSHSFTVGKGESHLTKGRWKITIVGDGFDHFTLDKDVVEIQGPEGAVVRVAEALQPELDAIDPDRAFAKWYFSQPGRRLLRFFGSGRGLSINGRFDPIVTMPPAGEPFRVTLVGLTPDDLAAGGMERLQDLQHLETLAIELSGTVTAGQLGNFPDSVRALEIGGRTTANELSRLPRHKGLPSLFLDSLTSLDPLAAEDLEALRLRYPTITRLSVNVAKLTQEKAKVLAGWDVSALEVLRAEVEAEALRVLAGSTSIMELCLTYVQTDDASVAHLSGLEHLEVLALRETPLVGEFLSSFAEARLKNICFGPISDRKTTISGLSKMQSLTEVEVTGPNWTASDLSEIAENSSVPMLTLYPAWTAATAQELTALKETPGLTLKRATTAPIDYQVAAVLLEHGAKLRAVHVLNNTRHEIDSIADLAHANPDMRLTHVDLTTAETDCEFVITQLSRIGYKLSKITVAKKAAGQIVLGESSLTDDDIVRLRSFSATDELTVLDGAG